MRKQIPRVTFVKMVGALALLVACLALLSPCFTASASRGSGQDLPQSSQGVPAPSQSIQPTAVAVINFRKLAQKEAKAKELAPVSSDEESQVAIHPPLTIPDREDSAGEAQTEAPATSAGSAPSESLGPLIPSPGPAANFQAIEDDTHNIPPDTMGAVGPNKIFVNVNGNYRVLDKATGATLGTTVPSSTFWSAVTPPVSGVFDPRVVYDPYNNRWIVAAASNNTSSNASILVGVSASNDPQGSWMLARYVVGCGTGQNGCNASGEWADFPMLGFNKNWIAVGWNVFTITGGSNVGGKMLAIDYPSFRGGNPNASSMIFTVTQTTNPSSQNFCMHPAETYSATEETLYVPAHFNSSQARYQLHKITGTPSAPVYTLDTMTHLRSGAGGWQSISGDILPQNCTGTCPPTLAKINSGDQFLRSNVVFRNDNIWYSQTIGLAGPSPSPTVSPTPTMHSAVQWTRIDKSGTFVDGGRVEDPNATADNGGEWYAYPSIAVNAHNDVLLGFSTFSSGHFARAAYAFRAGTDASMRDPVVFKEGTDYYAKTFSGTPPSNRWGDYSHTVVDPANDLDMWTVQEYAATRTNPNTGTINNGLWGTWWAKVSDIGGPPVPTPSPTATPSPIPSPTPPSNDNFASAQPINGCTGTVTGNNNAATKETGEPSHDPSDTGSGSPRATVWYKWQAPATASVTFDTIGSDFDTILAVYTGGSVGSLTRITFQDDIDPGNIQQSQVTFPATAGTVYMIVVDGYAPETGNIKLNWTEQSCATTVQFNASNFSVGEGGGSATITVTRSGNTSGTSTVDYKTTDADTFSVNCSDKHGNAFGRCDFATVVGTLSFAGGETSKTFNVPIIDDGYAEGPETFGVGLTNPSGATAGAQGTATVTINDNETTDQPNPILQTNAAGVTFFVRQQYLDFLGREPEPGEPWSAVLNGCADQFNTNPNSPSANCDRITVSGAFFGSPEYKTKGFYVIDMYRVAFNRLPTYVEFSTDLASVVGTTAQETFAKRAAYADNFVQRGDFMGIYNSMGNSAFVNALMSGGQGQAYNLTSITTPDPANPDGATKVTLNASDLIARLNFSVLSRAQVLRAIAQSDEISLQKEAVNAFVGSQYYGYLRRTPDAGGFNSWVTYLTNNPNDFRTMVNGFLNSTEYRLRFGPVGAAGPIETTTKLITAGQGGTISLPSGSSVSIPAGFLTSDQQVTVSLLSSMSNQPPSGLLTGVGRALSITFSQSAAPATSTDGPGGGANDPASSLQYVLNLGPNPVAGVAGSAPLADVVDLTEGHVFLGIPGTFDPNTGIVQGSIPATALQNGAAVTIGQTNLNPLRFSPPPRYGGRIWNPTQGRWLDYPEGFDPSKKTLILEHGVNSSVEGSFGQCVDAIMAAGGYQQVVGFNYDWTKRSGTDKPDDAGSLLAAFLNKLHADGLQQADIQAHSFGTVTALAAMSQSGLTYPHVVLEGGPLNGTPIADHAALVTILGYGLILQDPHSVSLPQLLGLAGSTVGDFLSSGSLTDLTPGSQVLQTIRSNAVSTHPETSFIKVVGQSCFSNYLPQLAQRMIGFGNTNDCLIPGASASTNLPGPTALFFNQQHEKLECDPQVIHDVGLAVNPTPTPSPTPTPTATPTPTPTPTPSPSPSPTSVAYCINEWKWIYPPGDWDTSSWFGSDTVGQYPGPNGSPECNVYPYIGCHQTYTYSCSSSILPNPCGAICGAHGPANSGSASGSRIDNQQSAPIGSSVQTGNSITVTLLLVFPIAGLLGWLSRGA